MFPTDNLLSVSLGIEKSCPYFVRTVKVAGSEIVPYQMGREIRSFFRVLNLSLLRSLLESLFTYPKMKEKNKYS